MTAEEFTDALEKLKGFESMTWGEMQQQHRPSAKAVDVSSLCAAAQRRLVEIGSDDLDTLWELHVTGTLRVWGIRTQAVFSVLWFDPEHTVCPSKKRAT